MAMFTNDMRQVCGIAVIPAAVAVLLVIFGVEDVQRAASSKVARLPLKLADLKQLDRPFWLIVALGVIFTLARFSEAFLILKASAEGLPLTLAPAVLVVMNAVYALGAYPAGIASDWISARSLLIWSLAALILADLTLALAGGLSSAFAGIALWGLHMALSQGLMAKMVADRAPEALRGSAFGLFNLATGGALLAASVLAGILWERSGPAATFLTGAGLAAVALCGLLVTARRVRKPSANAEQAAPRRDRTAI